MRVLIAVLPIACLLFNPEYSFTQNPAWDKIRQEVERSPVFARSFTGFVVRDAETGATLCEYNADKYFTPASCAKILTLATCLAVLPDSVPAFQWAVSGDTGYLRPFGDPTFLHPKFAAWRNSYRFLEALQGTWQLDLRDFTTPRFGPGWAWDDYPERYSAERSAFPIYGNMMWVRKEDAAWQVAPSPSPEWGYFRKALPLLSEPPRTPSRTEFDNHILIPPGESLREGYEKMIPTFDPDELLAEFLPDTLHHARLVPVRSVAGERATPPGLAWQTLYNTPLDTVLRLMMYDSDNFLAEQLLIACAGVKYPALQQEWIIDWAKDSLFTPLYPVTVADRNSPLRSPRWVDGSGLSRYNLVTPRYLSDVLRQLWCEQPQSRLFSLFPAAGAPETTLDWWQPAPALPWLFAKTGSMSGVQCLSGYLVLKNGKVLVFSFMHNNFTGSTRPWKEEMRRILEKIRE